MRNNSNIGYRLAIAICLFFSAASLAVTSNVARHSSAADFLKGQAEDIIIGSRGTLQLGRKADVLAEKFEDVWSINSIVVSGETIYLGTSPNGGIYKYSLGKLTRIYSAEPPKEPGNKPLTKPNDANKPADANETARPEPNTTEVTQYLANEHIFAMATDVAGRLLAGISGDRCRLMRFEAGPAPKDGSGQVIFEPNDARYIFAITLDDGGAIYLGTGPEGKIYSLDSFGKKPQLVYDSLDKNILSLAVGKDGFIYAGSDSRGLIYKIEPRTKTATVLYDSDQPEITAMLFAEDATGIADLYAAATSAQIVETKAEFVAPFPPAGRPEPQSPEQESAAESKNGRSLQIANTKKSEDEKPSAPTALPPKGAAPGKASYIYRITAAGYVTDVFTEAAVFFCLAEQGNNLLVGTGNNAQLFTVEPASEQEAVIYEDEQASQITAVVVNGDDVYLGTANPAKLIRLGSGFAAEGTYTSDLIDAGQPANWGKLQIEADIPDKCKVRVASRSGNVSDVNDSTFSDWTEPAEVTEPVQLRCPLGRFCQYKLIMQSPDGRKSPIVREVAVANTVPNLAPKVESVSVDRLEAADKTGLFKISYKAKDDNNDKLVYKIDYRKTQWTNWIELEDETENSSFEWDGRTTEDGRYEVRVTASDERSNTTATKLTASRISEPVVVDNTAPMLKNFSIKTAGKTVTLKLNLLDELSAIGKVEYTVDSNVQWKGAVPDDGVYDTTAENFTIVLDQLKAGEHIISVRFSDDVGNTAYKTFEANITGD
jgi:hypothetical protein